MDPEVITTVLQLSQYLCRHPDACDAPDGIARWWVAEPLPASQVQAALDWMAACGVVEAVHAVDGRLRYRRASADAAAAVRLEALARDPSAALAPPAPGGLH